MGQWLIIWGLVMLLSGTVIPAVSNEVKIEVLIGEEVTESVDQKPTKPSGPWVKVHVITTPGHSWMKFTSEVLPLLVIPDDADDFGCGWDLRVEGEGEVIIKHEMSNKVEAKGAPESRVSNPYGFMMPVIQELPDLGIDVFDVDDKQADYDWVLAMGDKILLTRECNGWSVRGMKVTDSRTLIEDAKDAEFSVMCPDEFKMSELLDLFDLLGENRRVVRLINKKGESSSILLNYRGGCRLMPDVEPMQVELIKKGARLNKGEVLSEIQLGKLVDAYENLVTEACVVGRIELLFSETNKELTYRSLVEFMTRYKSLSFEFYVADPEAIGCGGLRNMGIEILPSSPHVKGHRWIDRRTGGMGKQLFK
ncbi:MAG: hypothetical protein ACI9E1_001003 [Cryomorphaceae bacterium]|jgi:hypothetical protein